jgi:hypothetical protein
MESNKQPTREDAMTTASLARTPSTPLSSVTVKDVRPQVSRPAKVKRFLNTLMRSLAAAHA